MAKVGVKAKETKRDASAEHFEEKQFVAIA